MRLAQIAQDFISLENIAPIEAMPEPAPEQVKTEQVVPLPEFYVPASLSSIRITCEQIQHTVDSAENNISLLEASLGVIQEDQEVSTLGMTAIISQIDAAAQTLPLEDEIIVKQLSKELTTDNPYKYEAVLEALAKTIGSIKPVILKGLKSLTTVNNYLNQNIDLKAITVELNSVSSAMTAALRPDEKVSEGGSELKNYDLIVKAVESNQEPDQIPSYITSRVTGDSNVSVTACALISKGLRSVKLKNTRVIDVRDLTSLGNYLDVVIASQKAMDVLLDTIIASTNVQQLDDAVISQITPNITQAISGYWATVSKLGTKGSDRETAEVSNVDTANAHTFTIMPGWTGVVLLNNGKSFMPTVTANSGFGIIKANTVTDMASFMGKVATGKFSNVVKLSAQMNVKVSQIASIAERVSQSQAPVSDVALDQFMLAFGKLVTATKFMSDLTFSATEAYQGSCTAVTNVARGLSVLAESE